MTIPMPEPFMYGIMEPDGTPYFGELCVSGNKGDLDDDICDLNGGNEAGPYQEVALITIDQAEAYKDACVREALTEVAEMCDNVFSFSVGDSIRDLMYKMLSENNIINK